MECYLCGNKNLGAAEKEKMAEAEEFLAKWDAKYNKVCENLDTMTQKYKTLKIVLNSKPRDQKRNVTMDVLKEKNIILQNECNIQKSAIEQMRLELETCVVAIGLYQSILGCGELELDELQKLKEVLILKNPTKDTTMQTEYNVRDFGSQTEQNNQDNIYKKKATIEHKADKFKVVSQQTLQNGQTLKNGEGRKSNNVLRQTM